MGGYGPDAGCMIKVLGGGGGGGGGGGTGNMNRLTVDLCVRGSVGSPLAVDHVRQM